MIDVLKEIAKLVLIVATGIWIYRGHKRILRHEISPSWNWFIEWGERREAKRASDGVDDAQTKSAVLMRGVKLVLQGLYLVLTLSVFGFLFVKVPVFMALFVVIGGAGFLVLWLIESRDKRKGFDARCVPPSLDPKHSFSPDAYVTTGGWRIGKNAATPPFGVLTCDRQWLQIRVRPILGPFTSKSMSRAPVWIPRNDFVELRELNRRLYGRRTGASLLFVTELGQYAGVMFWHPDPDDVINGLARHGWLDESGS